MENTSECQPHQLQMLDYVQQMLESEMFADVTICCQGRRLKAHRVLLSASSPYLQKLLLGQSAVDHVTLILGDVHHEDMAAILLLVYTGQVSVAKQRFETFMSVAELLDVHILNPIRDRATGYCNNTTKRFELGTTEDVVHKRWKEDEKKFLRRLSIEEEYKYKLMKLDQETTSYNECFNYVDRAKKFCRESGNHMKFSKESTTGDRMQVVHNEEANLPAVIEQRQLDERLLADHVKSGRSSTVRRQSTSTSSVGNTDKVEDISVSEILSNLPGMTISKVSLRPTTCSMKKQRSNSVSNDVNLKTVYNKNDENRCVNPRTKPLPSLMPITNGQLVMGGGKRQNVSRTEDTGVIYNENGLTVREGFVDKNNYVLNKTKDNILEHSKPPSDVEMLQHWPNKMSSRLPPNLQSITQAHCELEMTKLINAKRWRSEDKVMENPKQGRYSSIGNDYLVRPRFLSLRENGKLHQENEHSGKTLTPKEVIHENRDYWRLDERTSRDCRPKQLNEGIANDLTQRKSPNANVFISSNREQRNDQDFVYRSFLQKHSQSRDRLDDEDIQILESFERPFADQVASKQQVNQPARREYSVPGHEYLQEKLRMPPQYLNEQVSMLVRLGDNRPSAAKGEVDASTRKETPGISQVPDIRVLEKTSNGFIQKVAHSLQGQMTTLETLYPNQKMTDGNIQNGAFYHQVHNRNNSMKPSENYILNRTLGNSHTSFDDQTKLKHGVKIINSKEPILHQGQMIPTNVYNLNDPNSKPAASNLPSYRHQENVVNKQELGNKDCATRGFNQNLLPMDRRTLNDDNQLSVNSALDSSKRFQQRDNVMPSTVVRMPNNMTMKTNGAKAIVAGDANRPCEMTKQGTNLVSLEKESSCFVLKRFQAGGASLEQDGTDCTTPILKRGLLSPNACRMPVATKCPDAPEDINSGIQTQSASRHETVITKNNDETYTQNQRFHNGFPPYTPEFTLLKQKLQPNQHELKTSTPNTAGVEGDSNAVTKRVVGSDPLSPQSVSSYRSSEIDSPLLKISLQKHANIERILANTTDASKSLERKVPETSILEMTIVKKGSGAGSPYSNHLSPGVPEGPASREDRTSQDQAKQPAEEKPPREVRPDYACFDCGKYFPHPNLLLDHQMTHDGVKPYRCETCAGEFTDKGHWTTNHNQPPSPKAETFNCQHCQKSFLTRASLKVHVRTHTGIKPYQCGDCGKQFSQLRNFKYHQSIHAGTKEFSTTCPECGKYFNDRGYLSSHMKIHLNKKEYECQFCDKRFNQRVAYNMHVRIHTGLKPHSCPSCSKSFSRKMLLKQHLRIHTGERPFSCDVCGKAFADRSNMSLHMRLHSGIKPYSCAVCSKSFTKKHHLKTHMNFHLGIRPYSCVKCSLTFSQSSNMRTHSKRCSGTAGGNVTAQDTA